MVDVEDQLLRKASTGDQEALSELFERFGPRVRERIASEVPRRWRALVTAEDVMQQTYIDAFFYIRGFSPRGPGALERWLITVARNNLRNAIHALEADKRGGNRQRLELVDPNDSLVALYGLLAASESTPSGHAALAEARRDLEQALRQLPDDYRLVVRLYDLERCSSDAVASTLNRSRGAMFMLRARAHRALRQLMGGSSKYFSSTA